ncbi:hypothetical protein PMAYCL1PPCAC_16460, partial [Pristionchus mayeri]
YEPSTNTWIHDYSDDVNKRYNKTRLVAVSCVELDPGTCPCQPLLTVTGDPAYTSHDAKYGPYSPVTRDKKPACPGVIHANEIYVGIVLQYWSEELTVSCP